MGTNGFVASTPEAIDTMRLATVKSALKLESKGIRVNRGPKLRKPWALQLGLKANATYDEVIAEIQKRLDEVVSNPAAKLETI